MDNATVAAKFETFMATFLARTIRSTMTKGPLAEGPVAMFADVFDAEIGASIARGGSLRGIAEQIMRNLPGGSTPVPHPEHHPLHPEPTSGHQTSGFGTRVDPIDGRSKLHRGLDFGATAGTPIRAGAAGRVIFAGAKGGYGNLVVVDHGDGTKTRYAHCRSVAVRVGQSVEAGQELAEVGSTGHSTGPHLHFELRRGEEAVDPTSWLEDHTFPLGTKALP